MLDDEPRYVSLLCLCRWFLEGDPDIASLIGQYLLEGLAEASSKLDHTFVP